jgi:hypothetical protein
MMIDYNFKTFLFNISQKISSEWMFLQHVKIEFPNYYNFSPKRLSALSLQ